MSEEFDVYRRVMSAFNNFDLDKLFDYYCTKIFEIEPLEEGSVDDCVDPYDYIADLKSATFNELREYIFAMCETAFNRWREDPEVGEYCHNGILIRIDKDGSLVEISFIPISAVNSFES